MSNNEQNKILSSAIVVESTIASRLVKYRKDSFAPSTYKELLQMRRSMFNSLQEERKNKGIVGKKHVWRIFRNARNSDVCHLILIGL
jgi:hypothetical protein